jgi:hypothetical protein
VRELADSGAAPHLPHEYASSLLAAARRRCELDDAVLCALAGDELAVLDVSGATRLSPPALEALLPRLPRLEVAHLARCSAASASVLRALAVACPGLLELKLGGDAACDTAAASCIADLLPRLPRPKGDAEDWEAAVAAEEQGGAGTAVFGRLRVLIWPAIPTPIAELIRRRCPRVAVNPDGSDGDDAPAADAAAWAPLAPLAAAALAGARGTVPPPASFSGRRAAAAARPASPREAMTLAERFRAAYLSQAAGRRAREQRAAEREQRAELRCESAASLAAASALSAWLDAEEGGGGA